MSPRSCIARKCKEAKADPADAELLRDAYLIALGRQMLREANERRSHRHTNFEPKARTASPRGGDR